LIDNWQTQPLCCVLAECLCFEKSNTVLCYVSCLNGFSIEQVGYSTYIQADAFHSISRSKT